jgi:cystathionine beta-lyase
MDFDTLIDRRGTRCSKWDAMEARCGVTADDAIAMWVADMDFRSPEPVQDALAEMLAHGVYGYHGDDRPYREAIRWWMDRRHGWKLDPAHIMTTHGVVNGIAVCLDALTEPGDGIVLMTPVYHAFARVIRASGRTLVEMPLRVEDRRHRLDIPAWDAAMTGREKLLILCSPHNPGGRVWSRDELREVADFARRHDLVVISDEIHEDLVYPGARHVPLPVAAPEILDRMVVTTAASKTFNIAGLHTGQMTIPDDRLRQLVAARLAALGIAPNSFGIEATRAAYSAEGAAWLDELMAYLDDNRRLFDAGVDAIPGVRSMPLESTYLAWVDFAGTGMAPEEIARRVQQDARIGVNLGPTFGKGGENWLRFNFGTQRSRVQEAVERLHAAFADLQ